MADDRGDAPEFLSWHNSMQRHGLQGLQITKFQNYRYSRPKRD